MSVVSFSVMKTLAEIEAAVASLPEDKQEELMRFIENRLRAGITAPQASGEKLPHGHGGFPISKGRMTFTSDDVALIESEPDTTS